jgi:hypothetical protein
MLPTFHSARSVEKVAHNSPQRDEQPVPLFQLIVARRGLQTGGAFASTPSVGVDLDLDSPRTARASQPDARVNESNKALNQVQESLNFQLSGWFFFHTRFS